MTSFLLQPCGCPADVPCSCGKDGLSPGQVAQMRRVARRTMRHIATFLRYAADVDERSGQHLNEPVEEMEICCGVKPDNHGDLVAEAEATYQQLYAVRLPHWMADKARPLSRYRVTCAHGRPLLHPLELEQIGEPMVGPAAVAVKAGSVVI